MPLQEFWNDEPDLLWAYRNSYMEKEKAKIQTQKEIINFQTWLQGYYNFMAIGSSLSKGGKYISQPIELNLKPKTEREKKIETAQRIKNNMRKGKTILEQQRSAVKEQL